MLYASPIGVCAALWDGTVSTLRMYSEDDLRDMVSKYSEAYKWHWARHNYAPYGSGTLFLGHLRKRDDITCHLYRDAGKECR